MIVLDKLRDRASEVPLPQRNHSIEAFFLDRPNESLGVSIRSIQALVVPSHQGLEQRCVPVEHSKDNVAFSVSQGLR